MATYRIVTGDTLSSIASRFGTTTSALMRENGILNPDMIFVGQTLKFPTGFDNFDSPQNVVSYDLSDTTKTEIDIADISEDHPAALVIKVKTTPGYDRILGSSVSDVINAGGGNDNVKGYGGNDTLYGEDGDDQLYGGSGNDSLYGGAGADRLFGGAGADTLFFMKVAHSVMGERDTIYDFSYSDGDRVDLSAIDANWNVSGNQDFQYIGKAGFSGNGGELRIKIETDYSAIYADVDGDGVTDFSVVFNEPVQITKDFFIL